MIWQDLLIDRWIDAEVLRAASAEAFGVAEASVAVTDTTEQLLATPDSVTIILERAREYRDFPLQVMVVLRDDALVERHDGFDGVFNVSRVMARKLGASVLFAEGPVSPSEWVRVRPSGDVDIVALDSDDGDEVDSYFVFSSRPFDESQQAQAATPRQAG
jgi:hypothetical protein